MWPTTEAAIGKLRVNRWRVAIDILDPPEQPKHPYLGRPAAWIRDVLGEQVWSKQEEILESVIAHQRTAVPSCYSSGKSWLAARLACYWIAVHPLGEAFVVTTAPTNPQVRAILWREIGRAHVKGKLPGRMNQIDWWMRMPGGNEEIVAFGRKPDDVPVDESGTVAAFQGIHAPNVLVLIDEAAGIPGPLFETADSALLTNDTSRLVAIGNPSNATSYFAEVCKPGSGYHVIRIPFDCTPNFTGEPVSDLLKRSLISTAWVEDKRKRWGEGNPLWLSKALAQFPTTATDSLISIAWVERARQRSYVGDPEPNVLGVDVGAGGNKSTVMHRRGRRFRIVHRDQNPDTMQTCGNVIAAHRVHCTSEIRVDEIGIGRGVKDRLKEQGLPVHGINVSLPARDSDHYANLRAESYWQMREMFQDDEVDIDPDDDDLAAQLVDIKYKRTSTGKIQIESKEEMKRRGKESPDDADSMMLTVVVPKKKKKLVW